MSLSLVRGVLLGLLCISSNKDILPAVVKSAARIFFNTAVTKNKKKIRRENVIIYCTKKKSIVY